MKGLCRRTRLERQLQRESLSEAERGSILSELEQRERDITRLQRQRLCAEDFEPLTIIGRGAFGEVRAVLLCDCRDVHATSARSEQPCIAHIYESRSPSAAAALGRGEMCAT